jgi:hypothetical protein
MNLYIKITLFLLQDKIDFRNNSPKAETRTI